MRTVALVLLVAGCATAGLERRAESNPEQQVWAAFVNIMESGPYPVRDIRPYHEDLRVPVAGFLEQKRARAQWREWHQPPRVFRTGDQAAYSPPVDERVPQTQPEGSLEPHARKPPTAVGAGTTGPDHPPAREIVVPIGSRVKDLAILMRVPTHRILWAAYNQFGRLVSSNRVLPFAETKALAARFGYSARRPTGEEE